MHADGKSTLASVSKWNSRKGNYEFSTKFETAEMHIFNYPEIFEGMGKVLVCNSPLFNQIFVNM